MTVVTTTAEAKAGSIFIALRQSGRTTPDIPAITRFASMATPTTSQRTIILRWGLIRNRFANHSVRTQIVPSYRHFQKNRNRSREQSPRNSPHHPNWAGRAWKVFKHLSWWPWDSCWPSWSPKRAAGTEVRGPWRNGTIFPWSHRS